MWKNRHSVCMVFALVITVFFAVIEASCAETVRDSAQIAQKKLSTVEAIEVIGEGSAAELVIKLSAPATYTSYKTTSPLRLVIDFSQTIKGDITSPLTINKGNFRNVTVNRYDTDAGALTRVDVELDKDVDAVLSVSKENPGLVRISFPLLANMSSTPEKESNSKSVSPSPDSKSVVSENVKSPAPSLIPEHQVPRGRFLAGLYVKEDAIVISVNGGVDEYKTIRLSKPERLVIDLFGIKNSLESRIIPINKFGVSSARLGIYPDKLRIVFDTVDGRFPETNVIKSAQGLILSAKGGGQTQANTMGAPSTVAANSGNSGKPDPQETKPVSIQPAATSLKSADAPKNEGTVSSDKVSLSTVEMIDFQVVDGISRLAIKVSGGIAFDPPEPTPGFLTLTIKNALLPSRLQRSLETKGFVSPVLRITPLQLKSKSGTDTRIRVAMKKPAPYEYRREGDLIYIDFKHPSDMAAEKGTSDLEGVAPQTKKRVTKEMALKSELASGADFEAGSAGAMKQYRGRKVTLEFADAEVRKIFQLLSEVSNKNFVLGDDVTGSISIKLVNVPWDQALDIILDTKGLDKREEGNIIIIKGKGKFRSQAEEDLELKKQQLRAVELKSETFTINYSDLSGIVTQLAALKSERGIIAPDVRTNKVIVKDVPQAIEDMRNLLVQLDVPEKQVMIEARIVEATSTFTRSLGINWGIHYNDPSGSFLGITRLDTGFGGLTTAPPTAGTGTTNGGNLGITFGNLGDVLVNLRISAAASAGLIKIVSSPKIATLNNKTAKITQGQQIPYTASTSDKVETKFIEAALALEVTPHINANGTISMKIDAKNDSPGESTGGEAPPINKKQATTEMLLKDGETVVIGGIYVDNDTDSDGGVPFLMDIPFLGKLFKSNSKSKTKSELLIFITPRILET